MSDENTKATETPDSAASALSAGLGAWLPIETAPHDGKLRVLFMFGRLPFVGIWVEWGYQKAGWRAVADLHTVVHGVRYWSPIPDAPNIESEGADAASSRTFPCNDGLAGAPTEDTE